MTLRSRLVITTFALVAAGLIVTGVLTIVTTRSQLIARLDNELRDAAHRPLPPPATVNQGGSPPEVRRGTRNEAETADPAPRSFATLLVDPGGRVIAASPSGFPSDPDPLPDLSSVPAARLASGEPFDLHALGDPFSYRAVAIVQRDGSILVVAKPANDIEDAVGRLIAIWAAVGGGVLLLIAAATWLIIKAELAPVERMTKTADAIAQGDLSLRVDETSGGSEVGRLGHSLNLMLGQIQEAMDAREASERRLRTFVADASHELRTPVTAIRGYSELYRSGALESDEDLGRAMGRIESESKRMGDLVESMLLLARLDRGQGLEFAPVDLSALARDGAEDARAVDPTREIAVSAVPEAMVSGDEARLRQVVANLIGNALTHSAGGSPVEIEVAIVAARDGGNAPLATFAVTDHAAGIAESDMASIFDRFYRAEASRSRATGGAGLGLAIAKSIIAAHGGGIAAENVPGAGARFIVSLPLISSPSTHRDESEN